MNALMISRAETLTDILVAGRPSSSHRRSWLHASRRTHAPIGTMSPVSSAMGMNSGGTDRDHDRDRRAAAAPRTRRVRRLGELRLIVEFEVPFVESSSKDLLETQRGLGDRTHLRREKFGPVTAFALARYIAMSACFWSATGVTASSGKKLMPMLALANRSRPPIRIGNRSDSNIVDATRSNRTCRIVFEQDRELIAANAREHGLAVKSLVEPCRNLCQEEIAHAVAQRIVDLLETVEIEIEDRQGLAVYGSPRHGRLHPIVERESIEQAGENVVPGLIGQPFVEPSILNGGSRDAAECFEQPAD